MSYTHIARISSFDIVCGFSGTPCIFVCLLLLCGWVICPWVDVVRLLYVGLTVWRRTWVCEVGWVRADRCMRTCLLMHVVAWLIANRHARNAGLSVSLATYTLPRMWGIPYTFPPDRYPLTVSPDNFPPNLGHSPRLLKRKIETGMH